MTTDHLTTVLAEVAGVVRREVRMNGWPEHHDGCGPRRVVLARPAAVARDEVRAQNNARTVIGAEKWSGLLLEPVLEATAADTPAALRAALVDAAATAVAWLHHIDARGDTPSPVTAFPTVPRPTSHDRTDQPTRTAEGA